VLAGRAQPLRHQRQPHDHVPDHHGGEVEPVERGRDAGGEDQHPAHLHQRQDPVGHVVGVIGRGEPGEVHPRPPDPEEHRRVTRHRVGRVALGKGVVQLRRGQRHCDYERQVEQQLQRRRCPADFVGVAAGHPPPPLLRQRRDVTH